MAKSFLEDFVRSPKRLRVFEQERAISEITALIRHLMEEQSISNAELARKLGKTKGWVTQLLDGERNKTVRTVADVFAVLGRSVRFRHTPIEIGNVRRPVCEPCPRSIWQAETPDWHPNVSVREPSVQVG